MTWPFAPRQPTPGTGRSRATDLRAQLLALACFTLVSVSAVQWMTLERVRGTHAGAVAREIEHNEGLALAHEEQIRLVLRGLDEALLYAASDAEWILRALAGGAAEPALPALRGMPVGLATTDPTVISPRLALGLPPDRLRELVEHHRGLPPLTAHVSAPRDEVTTLSRGIADASGRFSGVVFVRLEPRAFLDFFSKAQLQPDDLLLVVGTDGLTRARRAGSNLSFGGDHRSSPLVRAVSAAPEGSFIGRSHIDGVQRFYSYRTLAEFGLVAAVATSYEQVMAPVYAQTRRYWAFAGLVSFLFTVGSLALGALMVRQARSARRLAVSEGRFRALAQLSADWFWETDAAHRFTSWDPVDEEASPTDMLKALLGSLEVPRPAAPDSVPHFDLPLADMDARRPFREVEYVLRGPPDAQAIFLVSGEPVFDARGVFRGYRGVARDVTAQRQAQAAQAASEARLAGIVESAMDAIIAFDGRQSVVLFNGAAARMFRCSVPDAIGRTLREFLPGGGTRPGAGSADAPQGPAHYGSWHGARRMQAVRATGEPFAADVSLSHVEVRGERLYTVVLRDVTDQLAAEAALKDREESYRLLFESMNDGLVLAGRRYEILDINPAACRLLGAPRVSALGRPVRELFGHASEIDSLLASCAEGAPSQCEIVITGARGTPMHLELACSAFLDSHGRRRVNLLVHDVSARVEAQVAQEALSERLRHAEKLEALGRLAGGVAHDFNNFIAAILGNASLAQMRAADAHQVRQYVNEIQRAGLNAQQVVQKIMTFSQQRPASFTCRPLGAVVAQAVEMLRPTLPAGVTLSFSGAAEAGQVLCDETQIHQVVMNLGANAWQAMPRRRGHIQVTVERVADSNDIRLTVQDDGAGMTEETRQRLFEPFFTTKPMGEGTGLGLAVVHGIVQAHRGRIHVSSLPELGCRVDVDLPLCDPQQFAAPAQDPSAEQAAQDAAQPEQAAAPRPHVVYVDDYDVMAEMTRAMLTACGMRVTSFLDSTEALEFVRNEANAVDVFVTDYNMPGMSGLELSARVRRLRPALPIIVSSGYITPALAEGAHGCGVNAIADKTAGIGELDRKIRQALAGVAA